MNGMQIWEVNGIDDLEGTVFAQCSTKEKAEKAMELLEKEGFEGMLVVEQSGLRFDQLLIGEKLIQLQQIKGIFYRRNEDGFSNYREEWKTVQKKY